MSVQVRSYGKINIGLCIGAKRASGYHELRTVYQTIALHDQVRVEMGRGAGIEIRCRDPRVPLDESNTCWRVAERVMKALKVRRRVRIEIEKRLPVQGGLGAASSNAVATMLGMERALRQALTAEQRWQIAADVGSDLNLFLLGGTVLGAGRGEEVFPLPDLPAMDCVLALPEVGVSTPQAFARWDAKLTEASASDRMMMFSRRVFAWLAGSISGVPAGGKTPKGGNRAETLLLDLVRAGIENDFERVIFPECPELGEVKRVLEHAGAKYSSLSGSGSTLYGLFTARERAKQVTAALKRKGVAAQLTRTLSRAEFWKTIFD